VHVPPLTPLARRASSCKSAWSSRCIISAVKALTDGDDFVAACAAASTVLRTGCWGTLNGLEVGGAETVLPSGGVAGLRGADSTRPELRSRSVAGPGKDRPSVPLPLPDPLREGAPRSTSVGVSPSLRDACEGGGGSCGSSAGDKPLIPLSICLRTGVVCSDVAAGVANLPSTALFALAC
jgi:hypothetical protein